MVLRVTWCYIHLQLSASSFICPILSTSQGRLIDRGGHMWLPLAGNMCDPHATIRKVSITRSRPRCWPSVTRSTLKILDHLIAFVTFSLCITKIFWNLCVANAAVSKLTLPGAPPLPPLALLPPRWAPLCPLPLFTFCQYFQICSKTLNLGTVCSSTDNFLINYLFM